MENSVESSGGSQPRRPQPLWKLSALPIAVGLAAFAWLAIEGWRQFRSGEPLTAWAILAPAGITCAAVVLYLPLAWDRYLLPLQPWSALLVAGLVATTWSAIARALARSRRPSVPAPE